MYVCRRCSLYSLSERLPDISVFFFNDTATTEIYTLSLHDALPIFTLGSIDRLQGSSSRRERRHCRQSARSRATDGRSGKLDQDRKSTRLNSSHSQISYAVFCLKKQKPRMSRPS